MPVRPAVTKILVLFAFTVVLIGCAASNDDRVSPAMRERCGAASDDRGSANPQMPIVCVNDAMRTLSVSPDPVRTHDVLETDRKSPVVLHWFTRSGSGDLRIKMRDEGCVRDIKCDGRGHCMAHSIPGASKQCKYDVLINDGQHEPLDPTIVMTSCCT
jgi:hypothetical protein